MRDNSQAQKIKDCIDMMDAWLKRRDEEIKAGTYYDDDEEDFPEQLGQPKPAPFSADSDEKSPPERIHAEPNSSKRKSLF